MAPATLWIMSLTCIILVKEMIASDPIRKTRAGRLRGFIRNVSGGKNVEVYLGVPFAKPPVGDLRFEVPQPVTPWSGVRAAMNRPPMCIQEGLSYVRTHSPNYTENSEDCLYLNVFVPSTIEQSSTLYPVLAYIHGGSNIVGASLMLDPTIMASYGNIIVVTIAYRLGVLGFFGMAGTELSGNYGMHDQIQGLQWIQNNIEEFGGNRNMVTLMGHSAGAWDIGVLIVSPLAKGLFKGVVCQSGSLLSNTSTSRGNSLDDVELLGAYTECARDNIRDIKACMKNRDATDIIRAYKEIRVNTLESGNYRPFSNAIYPSKILERDPMMLLKSGNINGDFFMTGVTETEADFWVNHTASWSGLIRDIERDVWITDLSSLPTDIIKNMYATGNSVVDDKRSFSRAFSDAFMDVPSVIVADILAQRGKTVYLYQFTHRHKLNEFDGMKKYDWMGVPHGMDMLYLFGVPLCTLHCNLFRYGDVDRDVSRKMIEMWSNFVKNKNPAPERMRDINFRFSRTNRSYFRLSSSQRSARVTLHTNFRDKATHFWNIEVPALIKTFSNSSSFMTNILNPSLFTVSLLALAHMTLH